MTLSVSLQQSMPNFSLDVTFEAPSGITVLFGESGSGKTTTINAIAGLLTHCEGRVTLSNRVLFDSDDNKHLKPYQRNIGYIFQESRLFPHLTVEQNLNYAKRFKKADKSVDFNHIVELLGIKSLLKRAPSSLSGGEKQRVAIGRALLSAPDLILADEPLAALDGARKAELLPYFKKLNRELGIPMLYVTHSPQEVLELADHVIALEQGRIVTQGPAREVMANSKVARTANRAIKSTLTTRLVAHHSDGLSELQAANETLYVPSIDASIGTSVCLELVANDLILSTTKVDGISALNQVNGTVESIENIPSGDVLINVCVAGEIISTHITSRSLKKLNLNVGDACVLIIKSVNICPSNRCKG